MVFVGWDILSLGQDVVQCYELLAALFHKDRHTSALDSVSLDRQNLILPKGPAWPTISSLEPQLDIWKFVTSTELVIHKNHLNILWERMLYTNPHGAFRCVMAEQTPLYLLFYNVFLHPQPTEIIPTEIILFGSSPERLLTYCGNCKPSRQGHGIEVITMQAFQDWLCCESTGP